MARHIIRPVAALDGGPVRTIGSGNVLGDNSNSTWKEYQENGGSVCALPGSGEISMPPEPVIAVAVGHRQSQGGDFWLYNGWVCSYIRYDGEREPGSRNYQQDGTRNGVWRTIYGPPVYNADGAAWTANDIARMSVEAGAVEGSTGPGAQRYWTMASEVFLVLYTEEPVGVPTHSLPGNGSTSTTSSINFQAVINAQDAQPTRAVWQVARDSGFSQDLRTLTGDLVTGTGALSNYTSVPGTPSWTDLGPGTWYVRVKGRDFRNNESEWGPTRSFVVNNAALPSATVAAPESGSTVFNPYARRSAFLSGGGVPYFNSGLRVGARWQFSRDPDFTGGAEIEWLNLEGRWTEGTVEYDPQPRPDVDAGGNGSQVSFSDPDQRLTQDVWHVRVRAESKYGQFSGWSNRTSFIVDHKPSAAPLFPTAGSPFDPETQALRWRFVDPWSGDSQTAYRVWVQDDNGNMAYDTGWVESSITQAVISPPESYFDSHLHYTVYVRDLDGVEGQMSGPQEFLYAKAPAVEILTPAHESNEPSGQPNVAWSVQVFGNGIRQEYYRVQFFNVGDRVPTFDSGTIAGTATTYTPPRAVLENMNQYLVSVSVTDAQGIVGTGSSVFLANFIRPGAVDTYASASNHASGGYVSLEWSGDADLFFEFWRIYRRRRGSSKWTQVGEITDREARAFRDWTAAGTQQLEYAVVQVANRYGSLVEGDPDWMPATVSIADSAYWLVIPEADFGVPVIPTGHSITRTREKYTMDIIGRGKKVNYGDSIGGEGSLTIRIRHHNNGRTGQEVMELLDEMVMAPVRIVLRDPFGGSVPVSLGEYSLEREPGVGRHEMGELTIPYVEVLE